ncbi:MAG: C_GCAxxG_C_C family protein [Chloroflexi bacterium]|nr:C_GCAxxG_C_C family protein [Chloroflexota bacterium]
MQEVYGIQDEVVPWAALALGGGIARCQDVCGAVTGGSLAVGLSQSLRGLDHDRSRDEAYERARSLYRRFQERFGAVDCRTLTGHDFSAPEGYTRFRQDREARRRCQEYVTFVVESLAEQEQA